MEYFTLNNGVKMPAIGFGTFQIPPEETEKCVLNAIKIGYRCIDTAAAYYNEEGVGKAITKCGVPRKDLFIITKLWVQDHGYETTKQAIETSLKKLQTDYIDLYLIHQCFGDIYGSWRAMEEYYKAGKLKAIGISNFMPERFVDLCVNATVTPAVLQFEFNPFYQEKASLAAMQEFKIQPQAWSPVAGGRNNIFQNPTLEKIAKKHNKSIAQTVLRWEVQRGVQVIPKSLKEARMKENLNIFDFKLSEAEIEEINKMDLNKSLVDFTSIDTVKRFNTWKIHD